MAFRSTDWGGANVAPIDGSAPALGISLFSPYTQGHGVYAFSMDGESLLLQNHDYLGLQSASVANPSDTRILVRQAIAPRTAPVFVPGKRQVVFLGLLETPGVFEVFAAPYAKHLRPSDPSR